MQLRKLELPVRIDVETTATGDAFVPGASKAMVSGSEVWGFGVSGFRAILGVSNIDKGYLILGSL